MKVYYGCDVWIRWMCRGYVFGFNFNRVGCFIFVVVKFEYVVGG